jgi:hypothetical protein
MDGWSGWHGHLGHGCSRAGEALKESQNEQKHLAQRRKGTVEEKETKQLFISKSPRLRVPARDWVFSHSFGRPCQRIRNKGIIS